MTDVAAFLTTDLLDDIDQLSRDVEQRTAELRARLDQLGREAPPTRGRVLVVPALPGSQLGRPADGPDRAVWLELASIREGRLVELAPDAPGPPLSPLGVVEAVYLRLILALRLAGYDVDTHPYDWRRPARALGEELADRIRREGRPVDLVTHSFGGLVARAALRAGAAGVGKVIMMGTPNHGSFEVMQGIRGNHWVIHLLAAMGRRQTALELGKVCFGSWASVYDCLPERRAPGDLDAYDPGSWPREGLSPHADLLAAAAANRSWLGAPPVPVHLIAGYGYATIQSEELHDEVLQYHRSDAGDGLVPLDRVAIEGHACYYTRCPHIGIPNHGDVISAVEDILDHGSTTGLATEPPAPVHSWTCSARTR